MSPITIWSDNMKALIRENEIILEPFNEWVECHLEWLTTPRPNGDGYTLIDNYEPPEEGNDEMQ